MNLWGKHGIHFLSPWKDAEKVHPDGKHSTAALAECSLPGFEVRMKTEKEEIWGSRPSPWPWGHYCQPPPAATGDGGYHVGPLACLGQLLASSTFSTVPGPGSRSQERRKLR